MNKLKHYPSPRILLALLVCFFANSSLCAQTKVIDDIEVGTRSGYSEIRILFNIPLQYLNHVPLTSSDEIRVQLRSISAIDLSTLDTQTQQNISVQPSGSSALVDVEYESTSANQASLLLHFRESVVTKIRSSSDARSLLVEIQPNPDISPAAIPDLRAAQGEPFPLTKQSLAPAGRYVINLSSTVQSIALPRLPENILRGHVLYQARLMVDQREWFRLRLGFYRTKSHALAIIEQLKQQYPQAWVDTASDEEIENAIRGAKEVVNLPKLSRSPQGESILKATRKKTSDEKIKGLMDEAHVSMTAKEYSRAVQLYTKILQYPEHPYLAEAQEFLALARERLGQLAHAKAEYERYLQLFPEGEGADRVRQRLLGLTTARAEPRGKLRTVAEDQSATAWEVNGDFSQYYYRDVSIPDEEDSRVDQSSLVTDLDIRSRRKGENFDLQTRFSGSYLVDFLEDSDGNESRISSLYFDATARDSGLATRFGRQTRNTGGVLGRFDGGLISYPMNSWLKLNAVAGLPVFSSEDGLDENRYFYGISADIGTFANAWDFVTYIIEQRNDDFIDRQAIGAEARYFDPAHSLLSFVDYDIHYEELNTFLMLGTWTLPSRTTLNMTLDYRNSPLLMTGNALQGQPVITLEELETLFSENEIETLAIDRTARSKSLTLGFSHPLSDKYQISSDITATEFSATQASGGVEGIPGTGTEYFYNAQLIASSLFKDNDISILGVRYSDASTAKTSSLLLNTRYPISNDWRINPRLRFDYRENLNDSTTQWTTSPSLRMDYRWRKRYRFELEAGGEFSTHKLTEDSERDTAYFFSMGYRAEF